MSLPWLRLYTEYATDPKIQILAFDDQRHFVMLLCLKGNGTLDCEAANEAYRERLIAKALGLDASAALEAKRRLMEGGLITADWNPCKWEGRQYASDHDAAERQKRYRENKKRDSDVTVTTALRDSDATDKKRLDKTRRDKTEKKPPAAGFSVPEGLNLEAWREWQAYRKLKPASLQAAARKLAKLGDRQAEAVEHSIACGYTGLYPPHSDAERSEKPKPKITWRPPPDEPETRQ